MAIIHDIFGDGSAVASYPLDSDVQDAGGNYDGISTDLTYELGVIENRAIFNGASSEIDLIAHSSAFESPTYTFSAFVKPDLFSGELRTIFSSFYYEASGIYWGILIRFNDQSELQVAHLYGSGFTADDYLLSDITFNAGTEYHICVTSDSNFVTIYIDGVAHGSKQLVDLAFHPTVHQTHIGKMLTLGGVDYGFLDGTIDNARWVNKAVSPTEVITLRDEQSVDIPILTIAITLNEPTITADDTTNVTVVHDILGDNSALATYQLDNNVLDMGSLYDGTPYSITYDANGKNNECINFSGSTSEIVWIGAGLSAFKLQDITICAWVYVATHNQTTRTIINNNLRTAGSGNTNNSGVDLAITTGDKVRLRYTLLNEETLTDSNGFTQTSYVAEAQSSAVLPTGEWVSLIGVVAGNSSKLYINGVLDSSVSSTQTVRYADLDDNVSIGVLYYDSARYNPFNGLIDQVRFIKKAVSDAEAVTIYDELNPISSEGIIDLTITLLDVLVIEQGVPVDTLLTLSVIGYEPIVPYLSVSSNLLETFTNDVEITTNVHTPEFAIPLTVENINKSIKIEANYLQRIDIFLYEPTGTPFHKDNVYYSLELDVLEATQVSSNVAEQFNSPILSFSLLTPHRLGGTLDLKLTMIQPFVVNELITIFTNATTYLIPMDLVPIVPLEPFLLFGSDLKILPLFPNHVGEGAVIETPIDPSSVVYAPFINITAVVNYLADTPINIKAYDKSSILGVNILEPTLQEVVHAQLLLLNSTINSNIAQPLVNKKVQFIDGYELVKKLFWSQNEISQSHLSSKEITVDGGAVNSLLPMRKHSRNYEISSKSVIMTHNSEVDIIKGFINNEPHKLIFDDGSVETIIFNLISNPITVREVYEGSDYSYITLKVLL